MALNAFQHLNSQIRYSGPVFSVKSEELITSKGGQISYDYVDYPKVVVILGITHDQQVILVHQYRPPTRQILLELPAGKLSPNEDPLLAAQREFEEEAGYVAAKWTLIHQFYSAPGFCNEFLYLYVAEDLTPTQTNFDEDEEIEVEMVPLNGISALLSTNRVQDAKSLIGLLWAQNQAKNA